MGDINKIVGSKLRDSHFNSLVKTMKKNKPHSIISDHTLVPRVRQYLEDHLDQTYVDVPSMTQYLRNKYVEYSRRKEGPFRYMVELAYKTVLHNYGLDSSSSDKGLSDDDLHMIEEVPVSNAVKNTIDNLYSRPTQNFSQPSTELENSELIDISDSTDEESGQITSCNRSTKMVPATDPIAKRMKYNLPDLNIMQVPNPGKTSNTTNKSDQTRAPKDNGYPESSNNVSKKRKTPDRAENKQKKRKFDEIVTDSKVSFCDVGGIEHILKDLCDVLLHIKHPEIYQELGARPPRGFLLHGPPGCGKTLLAHAIAGKLDFPMISIASTELVAGVSGETEERIREVFEQASCLAPCVLFFDEVDVISSNRVNAQKDMDRRIVSQLISSIDGLDNKEGVNQVLVIGATNRVDNLDPSLRRVGRFDQEICLGIPDCNSRASILRVICKKLKLEPSFDFGLLAQLTPGYVGGDLVALSYKAASFAIKRVFLELKSQNADSVVEILDESQDHLDHTDLQTNKKSDVVDIETPTIDLDDDDDKVESTNDDVVITSSSSPGEENKTDDKTLKPEDSSEPPKKETDEENSSNTKVESSSVDQKEQSEEDKTNKPEPEIKIDNVEIKIDDDIEQMSVVSNNSADNNCKNGVNEPAIEWTLQEMEAWLDDQEPLLNTQQLKHTFITMQDFRKALKTVQPSAKREGFITVPNVTWDEVGSLKDIRQELQLAILAPIKYPERLQVLGLTAPSGVLLCGPPGCGKTLIAKAIANEAGINFISVKGPELLNMYVGESERAVRQCFTRARNSAPCVIFFDEFDALCPRRSGSSLNGGVSSRVVNQLLTEMDGIEGRAGVFLMAATNRPDILDPAALRPGRLDKVLYVGLPTAEDRLEILKAITKNGTKPKMHSDVNLQTIANSDQCNGYTGADLAGLVRQASMQALRESMRHNTKSEDNSQLCVKQNHFLSALSTLRPSVTSEEQKHYEKLRKKYTSCGDVGADGDTFIEPMDDS
ncbi:nuclear valosin-containing protein-like isoform X2 [Ctenocephalides felis]|uniref:nuclear valosin-containing protein-like isoform X2 n=1 Tax=Ctenocephalides felis TaxID=7515 RepID=UPI000E6E4A92|nr:nuclear valosin-containing protein-like isoform X2 [Ctenocephalides felis]